MARHLLITRAEEDGEATAARLTALGHTATQSPLLSIRYLDKAPEPRDWQAVLFTSANGVRALSRHLDRHASQRSILSLPALAVGDRSAAAAREAGFSHVKSAGGDVTTLAALVRAELDPAAGALLHIAGSVTAGDLEHDLSGDGYLFVRSVLYEAVTPGELPPAAREALTGGRFDGILFYSPRTARTFARLVSEAGLAGRLGAITAFCLSPAVAAALAPLDFGQVLTASVPTEDALLSLLTA
ncbi:MAG: uroporphyrinogen-III synthase [Parvibaculaceae bacterium]|nr:uroporphyrinogen-III synthase [Parvibaculaceae bacterium]